MTERYRALRGTKDILPEEAARWQFLEETTRRLFERYGFRELRTPLLEPTELFTRSVGASSDIVRKEMYTFQVGEQSVSLRPEATASVARAFVEHSLERRIASGYPERYYYMGPMFRHERPQKGRQRQFHQIGGEVLGAAEALADAETIEMVDALLAELGISERELVVNSVGDAECRPQFRQELQDWLATHLDRLCADCQRRAAENPLRVLDCKVAQDRELLKAAPTALGRLCGGCAAHFRELREALDVLGIRHRVDPHLVRGLDYYQRTVFEVVSAALGAQNAILGGGRYDALIAELGGPPVPGFGFSIGMERLILLLAPERVPERPTDLALVSVGAAAWRVSRALAQRLRAQGLSCVMPTVERPLGAQLRRADKLGARFALLIGDEELKVEHFTLRDLRSGTQEQLQEAAILDRVKGHPDHER